MAVSTTTALLIMDVQNAIVRNFPGEGYLARLADAIAAARSAGIPVIFVGVGFRAGHPEISPNNRTWAGVAANNAMLADTDATAFAPEIAPQEGDVVVLKKRIGAFSGSDLDLILSAKGITSLVLAGISTSGVVLSTVRRAADLDYQLTVLSDGCLDNDLVVHEVLIGTLFPRQAEVVPIADWTAALTSA